MKVYILDASVEFIEQAMAKPLQLSSGAITEITEARVAVRVRADGCEATGRGSIFLSDLWAWPEPALNHQQRDGRLRQFCREISDSLQEKCGGEEAHPLQLGLNLHHGLAHQAGGASADTDYPIPLLARAMCASPFDAAIHDATGIALNKSALEFYEQDYPLPLADAYFPDGVCHAIRQVLTPPATALNAWLIVGAKDDLERDIAPWVREKNYRHFKLKILGRDSVADVARTIEVYRGVRKLGVNDPVLCVDSNEANVDADSVLDYLQRLQAEDAEAFRALQYIEQPTGRNIETHAYDWSEVTRHKPVFLDEGLTSLELLPLAKVQGWSGLALKTCKGHSFTLAAAAWAHENNMSLTMQDLTNPGYAAIHSAILASHLPVINGLELNAVQFTPDANAPWLPLLQTLLAPTNGMHQTPQDFLGLGSQL